MGRLLSSPRRRRRLAGGGAAILAAGAIGFTLVHWSNTANVVETFHEGGQNAAPPPAPAPFERAVDEGVMKTAARFVGTAVVRKNVAESWDLTAPSLRAGYTRRTWATQDIPVQPYPVDAARWDVDYSWKDTVGLKVALFPKRGSKVPAAIFDMQLHAFGKGKNRRWLVDSWTPTSYTGVPQGPLLGGSSRPQVEFRARLGPEWLVVPLSIFLIAMLVPLTLAARGWQQRRAALAKYRSGAR